MFCYLVTSSRFTSSCLRLVDFLSHHVTTLWSSTHTLQLCCPESPVLTYQSREKWVKFNSFFNVTRSQCVIAVKCHQRWNLWSVIKFQGSHLSCYYSISYGWCTVSVHRILLWFDKGRFWRYQSFLLVHILCILYTKMAIWNLCTVYRHLYT